MKIGDKSTDFEKKGNTTEWHSGNDEMYKKFCNAIEQYNLLEGINKVIFLFSGGKDASFGLYFLSRYLNDAKLDIDLRTIMITYPTHVYFEKNGSEASIVRNIREFWASQNIVLDIFTSEKPDLEDGAIHGCKTCKTARKEIVDNYLFNISNKEQTAIVTGYTLYDMLAYLDEYCLLTNFSFNISQVREPKTNARINNCLHKMNIKEELPNGYIIIRPLLVFKENEILAYLQHNLIPYVNRPCKVSTKKHKRAYFGALNLISDRNNSSYEGVMNFLKKHEVELPKAFDDIQYRNYFTDC